MATALASGACSGDGTAETSSAPTAATTVAPTTTAASPATTPSTTSTTTTSTTTTAAVSSPAWSRVPDDKAVLGGERRQEMYRVTAGGPGLVAVGVDTSGDDKDAAVWTSPDGITWSRVSDDEAVLGGEGEQLMFGVTAGGPGLVAVGYDGPGGDEDAAVWTSPDGITWSRVPHDETLLGGEDDQVMWSVTAGGPGLVAVGYDGSAGDADAAVWTSPDGITWSRVSHDEAVMGGDGFVVMLSVTAGGPGLVAVGSAQSGGDEDATVWTSPDGITWSRVSHDEALFGGERRQKMWSVTEGGPGLVAVGSDQWTSPDGITWSRGSDNEAAFGGEGIPLMLSVTAGGPGLVAVSVEFSAGDFDAAVWTSPDGITWSRVPHDEAVFGGESEQWMWSVTAGGPGLVAVGHDGTGGDQDGAVWVAATEG